MASSDEPAPSKTVSTEDLLLALLALEVDRRESGYNDSQLKTELLLSNVGLGYQQIARIMGKNPNAVRMMIARSKPKKVAGTKSKAKS